MLTVNPAQPSDISTLVQLTEEMDLFYGERDLAPIAVRLKGVREALRPPVRVHRSGNSPNPDYTATPAMRPRVTAPK